MTYIYHQRNTPSCGTITENRKGWKERTTNQYSWQGIMPIYMVITTGKIYIYVYFILAAITFFLLDCRHN